MTLPHLCIQRPVMTTLIMVTALMLGLFAYSKLPTSDLPNVDFPTIQVSASLPGASPETMASSVATPLEREFSTIAGIDSMSSTSALGSTSVTLQFNLARDIDAAAQDVQAAIARTGNRLPRDMPSPPSYRKVNPADSPIMFIAVTSPSLPLSQINEYAETLLSQRLSMVPGVAQVNVNGSQKYAVRIQADPRELAARDVGIDELASAVSRANVNMPTGALSGPTSTLTVKTNGQLTDAAAYRRTIVAYRAGAPVRLEQLARVTDSVENDQAAAWFNSDRAIVLSIQRQPGSNTVAVVDEIRRILPRFREQLPASVTIEILNDRSQAIRESVHDVKLTLMLTLGLVILVIFLFLRHLRSTLIPSLAIPLSIVMTFMVMYLLDYSLDNLSLMALTLCVGFVVDDAIVMLENIVRHREMGKSALQAALDGSREIAFTIISMTLSLVAVFLPVLFMGGLMGRLLNEFAVTIAVAILASGFVSLTLTPMMAARFLGNDHRPTGRLYAASERVFDAALAGYRRTLRLALRGRTVVALASVAILAATVYMFVVIPKGFLPSEDTGRLLITTEAAEGTSFEAMVRYQQLVAAAVREHPAIESYMSSVGSRGGQGTNAGTIFARLSPRGQRPHVDRIIQELRPSLAQIPGVQAFMQNPPPIRIGGRLTKSQYQYTLQGPDIDELYRAGPALAERLGGVPGFQDVTTDVQLSNPQLVVTIDRDRAGAVGVSAEQVELALASAFGDRQITTIFAPTNDYKVVLELLPEYQADPEALSLLFVRSSAGPLVPLTAIADLSRGVGPLTVNHSGQLPAVTVSFNLAPGVSLGHAVEQVSRIAPEVLPATITGSFQGSAQVFQDSLQGLGILLLVAVLVTYAIMGILYESFIHPITILTALPFAGFGAAATLMLFGAELSLYAFVGVIMLVGIVKKNGIMMVDFALQAQRGGATAREAIEQACLVRFRPIMMTTMAALMGTLPIALGLGAGGESRQPLGLAVVGGLLFSQMVTLYATPVFFLYLESLRTLPARLSGRRLAHAASEPVPAEPAAPEPRPRRERIHRPATPWA